ncbi:zinc finger MYM-type protein 5-like, partial [Aphis craccivora]
FPNDPGKLPLVLSNELVHHFLSLGPCQPVALELLNYEFPKKKYPNGDVRSFHENFYHRKIQNGRMFVKRWWLSHSPSQDKFFCMSCKLFGLPKAKNSFLAKIGSNDYKNIKRTIDSHESWSEHITSEIARGLYQKNMRIDTGILKAANRQIAENRAVMSAIIEAILFIARQNIALREHDEGYKSTNRGNFFELLKLLSNYHAPLKIPYE